MDKKPNNLEFPDVKDYLVKGDRFTKWTEDSSKTSVVTMKMDSKGYYLYWVNQSRETTFLDVATIRDTRAGKYAKLPKNPKVRNVFNMDFPDSHHLAKTLTIVSGLDTVNLTYHNFFAYKENVSQDWATDILAIVYNTLRNNACRQIFLDKIYVRISLQTNKDGKIPVKNIYKMFPADKKRVESALSAAHLPKGKGDTMKADVFTEAAFKTFLMNLCPRPEIYEIFTTYSTKPYMTKENLTKFVNEKQRDSRLNEELFPPMRPEQVKNIIEKYEPCSSNANRGQISPEGLLFYLMGPETSVVLLQKLSKCHDMTQPLPHYLVKSSHNTYLTAGQFSGVSSPEMYRQCLLAGCRCLELDCWKGKPPEEEPIITHGFTMTTEILFKDVIEAIAESAFKTSPYPVILSFENHVDSVKQQEKMANYCKTIFGDALLTEPLENYPLKPGHQIPSPSEMMGKILIKNKKNSAAKQEPEAPKKTADQPQDQADPNQTEPNQPDPNQTEPNQTEPNQTEPNQTDASEADPNQTDPTQTDPNQTGPTQTDSNQTVTQESQEGEVHDDHEEHDDNDEQDEEKMKNSDEGTAGQEVTAYEAMSALVNYIQPNKFISFENAKKKNRSYAISSFVETKGGDLIAKSAVEFVEYNKRQMSRIYPKGTRMDSSNYSPQPFWTAGCQMVALNYQTMDFPMQLNMALFEFNGRTGYLLKHDLLRRSDKKFDPHTERFDTIIASTLTIKIYSGQFLSDKNVKTGVEVEIIGLPKDPKRKFRTKWSATANAINPVWNEEPFVFEKILLPEMASLRMVVHEESGKFLGHRIIPIDAIQPGFHHICLRTESNMPLTLPSIFVYIDIKDYIPAAFADFTDALFNPTKTEKPSKPHEEYVSPFELPPVTPVVKVEEQSADPVTQLDAETPAGDEPAPDAETPAGDAPAPDAETPAGDVPAPDAETPAADAPAPDAETPADDAPAPDGDSPVEDTPAQDTEAPSDDPPAKDGDAPAEGTSAQDGDAPADNVPAPDAEAPADAPAKDGEAPAEDTPAQDGDAPADDVPAPDAEAPADAPAKDGEAPAEDTPAQDGDTPADDTPAQDGDTPVDAAAVPSLNTDPPSDPAKPQVTEEASKDSGPEPSSVTLDELKQHKSFVKVIKKHEKEIREMEKKFQKKADDLILKYKESFKSLKKKSSGKRKESGGDSTPVPDKAVELKAKLLVELKTLWEGQYDLLKKKKEQHATEQLTKLLDLAAEKHAKETQALERVKKDKNGGSGTAEDGDQSTNVEALGRKQAATLEQIKDQTNQLNHEILSEHEKKTSSLPASVRDAVNGCVSPNFPELVEQPSPDKEDGDQSGGVFRG
ncbi:1-phosphatidylinositol 4,5-bisphosphate phosphodiesterase beta-2 isoform X1 [Anguilla rostrata]|uniref:1-phosphatidylinositol 4,5-bisphosphate phosphodiesterase beta-2 isoform X1 n=1 Tax=Anguilla rostrata TaxID=7938 RepID=UPI0030CC2C85